MASPLARYGEAPRNLATNLFELVKRKKDDGARIKE
jgi:hypothetical protein